MKKKILIADPESAVRYTIAFVLRMQGYEVREAGSGKEALSMILEAEVEAQPFDLLVTEIRMPELSGDELIRILQKDGFSLPSIVVTALRDTRILARLLNYGCHDIIFKPYDIRALVRRVDALLEEQVLPYTAPSLQAKAG